MQGIPALIFLCLFTVLFVQNTIVNIGPENAINSIAVPSAALAVVRETRRVLAKFDKITYPRRYVMLLANLRHFAAFLNGTFNVLMRLITVGLTGNKKLVIVINAFQGGNFPRNLM